MATPPSDELARLIADPACASRLSAHAIPALLAQIATEQGRLSAAQTALAARLLLEEPESRLPTTGADLLKARDAAAMLQMSVEWLYKNAKKLPFARRIGPRTIRFSSEGIRRYLEHRRGA
jgi:predicted DNA-binding transcriptional regulator AlpA